MNLIAKNGRWRQYFRRHQKSSCGHQCVACDLEAHKECVRAAGAAYRKERVKGEQAFVAELKGKAKKDVRRRLERIGETGAWLTVAPNKLAGNLLSAEEWRDNTRLRYGMRPLGLCDRCDGCGARFTVEHALQCSKGGLVVLRHDNVRDEAGKLRALAERL